LLVLAAFSGVIADAAAPVAATTTMSISPQAQTVAVNDTFTVDIDITSSESLRLGQAGLMFTPGVLEVTDVSDGGMFDIWAPDMSSNVLNISNQNGTIKGMIGMSPVNPVSTGTLAVVTFKATAAGTADLQFILDDDQTIVNTANETYIPATQNGTVTVTAGNQPPSTTITSGPTGTIYTRNVSFTWTGSDDNTSAANLTYSYQLDGPGHDGWSRWTSATTVSYTWLDAGTFTFSVKAQDHEGATGDPATRTFTVADDTAPVISEVTVDKQPHDTTATVNVSCSVSDNFAIGSVTLQVTRIGDGVLFNNSMYSTRGGYYYSYEYGEGNYTFTIWARDTSGNMASHQESFNVTGADVTPPTISDVEASPSPAEAGDTVVISATVTDARSDIADVYLDLTYPNGSEHHNFSILQNLSGESLYFYKHAYTDLGNYTFFIYAVDGEGNGNTSTPQTFEVEDTTPPSISNVTASPSPTSPGQAVNISAEIDDVVSVDEVYLEITDPDDDVTNHSITGNVTGDTYYSSRTYTELGTYQYTIYAIDDHGNAVTSPQHTFTIQDVTPPVVDLLAPNKNRNLSGTVDIAWNATDNYYDAADLEVTLKYSADDGSSWQTIVTDLANNGTYEWNTAGLDDGTEYLVKITVVDPSDNQGTDLSNGTFTLDNTDPTFTLDKPNTGNLYLFDRQILPVLRNKAVVVGKITVTVAASDATSGVDRVSFLVDGVEKKSDQAAPYEWLWDETAFLSHTLKIIVYDHAGNRAETSISVSIYNL
jgi:hypothetical protein